MIDVLTLDEFFGAIEEISKYRKEILPFDVTLSHIKKALFQFMGVKEQANTKSISKLKGLPSFQFTKDEFQKWIEAGSPNPSKFFKRMN